MSKRGARSAVNAASASLKSDGSIVVDTNPTQTFKAQLYRAKKLFLLIFNSEAK
jgi:hypothetical protein